MATELKTLNISVVGSGTSSKLGIFTISEVPFNSIVNFTATPNVGFKIGSVKLDGVDIPDTINESGSQIFNVAIGNQKPAFGIYRIVITFVEDTPDVINEELLTVPCGEDFSRYFEREGKTIARLLINGVIVTTNVENYTANIFDIDAPTIIKVYWKANAPVFYTVTVLTNLSNTGVSPQSGSVQAGNNFSTTITPPNGYTIGTISINSVNFTGFTPTGYVLNLTNIQATTVVDVVFSLIPVPPAAQTLQVIWSGGLGVTATVDNVAISLTNGLIHNIAANVQIRLTIQLLSGHTFDNLVRNSVGQSITFSGGFAIYEFNSSTINQVVNITASPITGPTMYNVNVIKQGVGSGTFTPQSATLAGGSNFSTVVTPAPGSFVHSAWIQGDSGFLSIPYVGGTINTITKTNQNTNILIRFDIYTYNVWVVLGLNGNTTSSGGVVNWGANFSVTITPSAGFEINTISVNNIAQNITNRAIMTISLTNIQADQTINATFRAVNNNLRINVSFGTIGNPNPGMANFVSNVYPTPPFIEVSPNTAHTLTATAIAGYRFGSVMINGTQVWGGGVSFGYVITASQMTINYFMVIEVLPD